MLASIAHCIFSSFLIFCLETGEVNGKIWVIPKIFVLYLLTRDNQYLSILNVS